jgi:hypothetical protein
VHCRTNARGDTTETTFTIHRDGFIAEPFVGFGGQMNPYLYCRPNWGDVTEQNVVDLERNVIALAPQLVRIFCLLHWWTPEGDPRIARGDPRMRESLIRTVRLAQRAGATVNLTLWYGPFPEPEKSARQFARVLYELIHEHELPAIRFVTLQNEVNGTDKISMEDYNTLYRAFDRELRSIGLRERIGIIGGDLVQRNQEEWFENLAEHQHDILNGYSVHMYWDYWDTAKLLRRVSEVPQIVQQLRPEGQKPIYIMEFGVRGHRAHPQIEPGEHEDGTPIADTVLQAMQVGWFMLEAINRGYLATVQWELYDAWYDRYMPFGTIAGATEAWRLKPAYHLLRLFTHTAGPGWRALAVEGSQPELVAAAMRGPEGQLTVYVLNRTDRPQEVSIAGLPEERPLYLHIWNQHGDGTTAAPIRTSRSNTVCTLAAPPVSLAALTNLIQ